MIKSTKISKKIILSFILVALIANIAGCVGLALIKNLDTSYSNALVTYGFAQRDIGDYNTYLNKSGALVRDVILLTDAADIQETQAELAEADQLAMQSLENIRRSCQTAGELELLKKIEKAAPKYNDACGRAVELSLQNKTEEALSVFRSEANPYLNECIAAGQALMKHNIIAADAISSQLTRNSNFAICIIIIVMLCATIAAVIFARIVSRSIS